MNKKIEKEKEIFAFAKKLISSDGHIPNIFLRKSVLKLRLIPGDPSLLEDFLLTYSFRSLEDTAYFVIPSNDKNDLFVKNKKVTLENVMWFSHEKTPYSGLILSNDFKNFCFFNENDDYFLLAGNKEFLKKANPLPLRLNKEYFFKAVEEDPAFDHFKAIWELYEPFMFKS